MCPLSPLRKAQYRLISFVQYIEVDARTADLLKARASARGMSVGDFIADLASDDNPLPPSLEAMRVAGEGPWSPDVLAEDGRRLAEFRRTREAVPWDDVKTWIL